MIYDYNVAFIGNPNCGKTTLFNYYTGANLKTANWPGVTVEKKEGEIEYKGKSVRIVDLPGIYSLTHYTLEERISRKYILKDKPDVIVDVIDASSLERNLYLALQLIEMGAPVIIALNMIDIVEKRGMKIDAEKLSWILNVPVVPISARKKTGLDTLENLIFDVVYKQGKTEQINEKMYNDFNRNTNLLDLKKENHFYSYDIENKIETIKERLKSKFPDMQNYRWYAIKFLEQDSEISELYSIGLDDIADKSYESEIIHQKYDYIEKIVSNVLINKNEKSVVSDKADSIFTHNFFGLPIFLVIMAVIFLLTFTIGDYLKSFMEEGLTYFSDFVFELMRSMRLSDFICSLVVDGIIAGVGGIITFLPNIIILFIALAFLEDSGYMARVAYIMDGIMGKIGLSGKAFIPMILGFGCTVPAVMASRTLENWRDRIRTILITPFMSCSARLPIYVIISDIFFKNYAALAAYSMYIIGIAAAIIIALVLDKFDKSRESSSLLIELPEYKIPDAHSVFIYVWEKVKDYIIKAGTTIFVASVILWFLLNFGTNGFSKDIENSFGAEIGKILVPIMAPIGLGYWRIIVALISGIAAKEVVVSSFSVLFNINNISSSEGMSKLSEILYSSGFNAANAYSFMLFCLLYIPCVATIGTIKKETGSFKWVLSSIAIQLGMAWCTAFLFYHIFSFFS